MAASFTISDDESETSEELEERDFSLQVPNWHPAMRPPVPLGGGRTRGNSESHVSYVDQEFRAGEGEDVGSGEGTPFRSRSQSAPAALWAAKKYGRQLRRMSDEFDSWLDKGEMRKVKSAGSAGQMWLSRSWWSNLFSHQETEVENGALHPENQSNRTE
ncbi:unnamed protein product [Boreogadus saida]